MDKTAKNYNPSANIDDNGCEYESSINFIAISILVLYFLVFFGVAGYLIVKDLRKRI